MEQEPPIEEESIGVPAGGDGSARGRTRFPKNITPMQDGEDL